MTHYKLTFANGQQVVSYYNDYITLITWEKMYNSKIVSNIPFIA